MLNKDEYIEKQKNKKKFANTRITLSKRAIELLAKQIVISRASPEKQKAINRNEPRVMKSIKNEMYAMSNKIDQEKLTNKQRSIINKRMKTLGRLPIGEFIDIEYTLFNKSSYPKKGVSK